jgi:molecular chaperone DnaK
MFDFSKPSNINSFTASERLVSHAKRRMGSEKLWDIDGIMWTPVDISAIILRKLIKDAERELGPIKEAVVTVPAHFSGYQRQLTIQAGEQAALTTVSVVNEPVAAALSYVLRQVVLDQDRDYLDALGDKSTILVYDLGGGTFDLSIVQYDEKRLRVIATSGEEKLGGIDWDQHLIDMVADPLTLIHGDLREDSHALARLAHQVERAKRALSSRESTDVMIQYGGWEEEFHIERREFEKRTASLVERTKKLTEGLLKSCNMSWLDLDAIIPVGGSIRMPMIDRTIKEFETERAQQRKAHGLPPDNFIRKVSPDLSIAQGAALFAGMIQDGDETQRDVGGSVAQRLSNYSMENVTPTRLGVVLSDDLGRRFVHEIIPRNTPLPASASLQLRTTRHNQQRATVRIVEGEGEFDTHAKIVCKCTIDGLPPGLPKSSNFDVNVMYDADGLLHLVAVHRDTGRLASVSAVHSSE